ncbi:divergent polysaccharide deacetylase family protein [Gammaproteobacteria bacterium]|nr:divergent polysaccharide deacetylase family protein [Gammaproteobacteria bacterium]
MFTPALAGTKTEKSLALRNPQFKLMSPNTHSENKPENFRLEQDPLQLRLIKSNKITLPDDVAEKHNMTPVSVMQDNPIFWRKNAVQLTEMPTGPKIAVVIDDAGLDNKRTASVIGLRSPLTISFLTYGENLTEQVKMARKAGHEVLVHIAMEPLNTLLDPGPNVLLIKSSPQMILRRLRWGLERFEGYVGVNNHMGSLFTSNVAGMQVVMRELKRRGLLFLDSRTSGKTIGAEIAREHEVPFTQRNIFLDNVNTVSAVNKQLQKMEEIAIKNGYAVAIAHPRDATIQALSQWLAVMVERGLVQVPISTIVAEKQGLSPINIGHIKD